MMQSNVGTALTTYCFYLYHICLVVSCCCFLYELKEGWDTGFYSETYRAYTYQEVVSTGVGARHG